MCVFLKSIHAYCRAASGARRRSRRTSSRWRWLTRTTLRRGRTTTRGRSSPTWARSACTARSPSTRPSTSSSAAPTTRRRPTRASPVSAFPFLSLRGFGCCCCFVVAAAAGGGGGGGGVVVVVVGGRGWRDVFPSLAGRRCRCCARRPTACGLLIYTVCCVYALQCLAARRGP